jgi:hypothetical protein
MKAIKKWSTKKISQKGNLFLVNSYKIKLSMFGQNEEYEFC